jgi:signal transduction histidine kinase
VSEPSAAALLDAVGSPAAVLGPTGRLRLVNRAWAEYGERNGAGPAPIAPPADYLNACSSVPEVADGILDVIAGRLPRFEFEYPCHQPDVEQWFRLTATPLEDGVLVVHTDITGEYGRISRWLDATSIAVIELTPSLEFAFANRSWRRRMGRGDGWTYPIAAEDARMLLRRLAVAAEDGLEFSAEVQVDGQWFRFVASPHRDAHRTLRRIVLVGLDVTTERTAIARRAADRERARLAAELHDRVVQRLYGTALALQRHVRAEGPVHLTDAIARIDRSIDDLRAIGRQPEATAAVTGSLSRQIVTTLADARVALGFRPDVRIDGDLEQIDERTGLHFLAVLTESLSNVARHAHALSCTVHVSVRAGRLTLVVTDDGVGMPDQLERRSGTRNMAQRAETLGGRALWAPAPLGGTVFTWQVSMAGPAPEAGVSEPTA